MIELSSQQEKKIPGGALSYFVGQPATHTYAATIGTVLTVLVTYFWPSGMPEIVPPIPHKEEPKISVFEAKIRKAWELEGDPGKAEKLKKLVFLYKRTSAEALNRWVELGDFYKSFEESEHRLQMKGQLIGIRYIIGVEWAEQIREVPPLTLTEPLRVRVAGFLDNTISILEKLK